jgi:hypothetical protein
MIYRAAANTDQIHDHDSNWPELPGQPNAKHIQIVTGVSPRE